MSIEETRQDLLSDLGLPQDSGSDALEALVAGDSRYVRDMRVNTKGVLDSDHLEEKESCLLALAIAVNERNEVLKEVFSAKAQEAGASDAEIAETFACASLLATNNVLYRYKHFIQGSNENYQALPARIKMNIMARPELGKEFFELMSLAVSAVNGCEACVNSHEASVRNLGSSEARVFDAVRLAAVVRGLSLIVH